MIYLYRREGGTIIRSPVTSENVRMPTKGELMVFSSGKKRRRGKAPTVTVGSDGQLIKIRDLKMLKGRKKAG